MPRQATVHTAPHTLPRTKQVTFERDGMCFFFPRGPGFIWCAIFEFLSRTSASDTWVHRVNLGSFVALLRCWSEYTKNGLSQTKVLASASAHIRADTRTSRIFETTNSFLVLENFPTTWLREYAQKITTVYLFGCFDLFQSHLGSCVFPYCF